MTKEQIEQRKEELKIEHPVPEILARYGIQVKNGRCRAICHSDKRYTAKVTNDYYYCFSCNKPMDIFDLTKHLNNCDFWTAFELLGGTEKPSFTAMIKANLAREEQKQRILREQKKKAKMGQIQRLVTAYRNIMTEENRMSDLYAYCYNKLQYQLYLLEILDEKR